jgi:hypothetical protein
MATKKDIDESPSLCRRSRKPRRQGIVARICQAIGKWHLHFALAFLFPSRVATPGVATPAALQWVTITPSCRFYLCVDALSGIQQQMSRVHDLLPQQRLELEVSRKHTVADLHEKIHAARYHFFNGVVVRTPIRTGHFFPSLPVQTTRSDDACRHDRADVAFTLSCKNYQNEMLAVQVFTYAALMECGRHRSCVSMA